MLTAWGRKNVACLKSQQNGLPYVTGSQYGAPAFVPAKSITGATCYLPTQNGYNGVNTAPITSTLVSSGNNASSGVAFGSDSTPPTENDYTLGHQVTGITVNTPSIVTYNDTTNFCYVARLDYVISNDSGADVTIAEIGLFNKFHAAETRGDSPTNASSNYACILIDRTALDTPVTIPSGSAATIRYEFVYEG